MLKAPALLTINLYIVPFGEVRINPWEVLIPTEISPPRTVRALVGFVVPIPTLESVWIPAAVGVQYPDWLT